MYLFNLIWRGELEASLGAKPTYTLLTRCRDGRLCIHFYEDWTPPSSSLRRGEDYVSFLFSSPSFWTKNMCRSRSPTYFQMHTCLYCIKASHTNHDSTALFQFLTLNQHIISFGVIYLCSYSNHSIVSLDVIPNALDFQSDLCQWSPLPLPP